MNQLVKANEREWMSLEEIGEPDVQGVHIKPLLFDTNSQRSTTILLKFDAGARYGLHDHPAGEEIYVLEVDIHIGKDHLFAGDYLYTAPGGLHAARSDGGATLFLKVPEATVFVNKRSAA